MSDRIQPPLSGQRYQNSKPNNNIYSTWTRSQRDFQRVSTTSGDDYQSQNGSRDLVQSIMSTLKNQKYMRMNEKEKTQSELDAALRRDHFEKVKKIIT